MKTSRLYTRHYETPEKNVKGDFWIQFMALHRVMPSNNLDPYVIDNAHFLSHYHRPIQVIDNTGLKECSAGTLIAWKKGTPIRQGYLDRQWENSYIAFGGPAAEEFLVTFPCNQALTIKKPKLVSEAYDAIFRELSEFDPADMRIIRNLMENLLRTVARDINIKDMPARIPQGYLNVKQFISDNHARPIQISQLAGMLGVSVAYFGKCFKKYFSCSPIEYLISIRMEQAARLMRDSNLSLSSIAHMVGYDNIHYFSRVVKNYHGHNPRSLRKKLIDS